jgi:hypothetical protein
MSSSKRTIISGGHMAKNAKVVKQGGVGGAYFLGMIGAAVYYLHTSYGFGSSVVALLKALVWPGFLVYHLLGL